MIRNASKNDFQQILSIKNSLALDLNRLSDQNYKIDLERGGFLIPSDYTEHDFKKDLQKTFIVYEQDGNIVGFLRIDEEPELRKQTEVNWYLPKLREVYFFYPHAEIGAIAVLPTESGKKIATQMLIQAERETKSKGNTYLFSLVPFAPIMNHRSIKFHEKNDFKQVAFSKPHSLFGMKDYQSILFVKEL